jgi:hypothetical protein
MAASNQAIQFVNEAQFKANLERKAKNAQAVLEKTAKQMGILACNEIHPLTAKKTGNWDSTIHAEVHSTPDLNKVLLWVGSYGAFAVGGYNYGAIQEYTRHPIEIGWTKAQAAMKDLFQKNITAGLQGREVTQNISTGKVYSNEFEMMAGAV